MFASSNTGKPISIEKFSIEEQGYNNKLRSAGVKYRKTSGKTPQEAVKKVIKFLVKNKDSIISEAEKYIEQQGL